MVLLSSGGKLVLSPGSSHTELKHGNVRSVKRLKWIINRLIEFDIILDNGSLDTAIRPWNTITGQALDLLCAGLSVRTTDIDERMENPFMEDPQSEDFAKRSNRKLMCAPTLFEVATVADMCVDLILRGNVRPQFGQREQIVNSYCLELGGSANIFATQMAKLGARTAVLGYVGSDLFGDFVLQRLMESGVDVSLVKRDNSVATGLGVTLAEPDDRAILTILGSIDLSRPCDLPDSPRSISRHWHVASPFLLRGLRSAWPKFLGRAKADGLTVSLDPNWDPDESCDGIKDLLPLVDVFLPNEAEATALTGLTNSIEAGRQLAKACPLVVIKRGSRGAIAVRDDRVWKIEASPVPTADGTPIDTVGAGDNFDAGFLRAWMLGKDIDDCLCLGRLCASESLSSAGGIRGQWTGSI